MCQCNYLINVPVPIVGGENYENSLKYFGAHQCIISSMHGENEKKI